MLTSKRLIYHKYAALREYLKGHGLTLAPDEARKVADLLGRDPTLTEMTLFDTMWSEHCSYKSSRPYLKKHLPNDASNVVIGPVEDAGVVDFGEIDGRKWGIIMAHESHNHPSQVMPVEGAATGIGGIVRDVYCMGGEVIATLDPLRFGWPETESAADTGAAHRRDIARRVRAEAEQFGGRRRIDHRPPPPAAWPRSHKANRSGFAPPRRTRRISRLRYCC